MPRHTKRPIEVMHCGECNHTMRVHKLYPDTCTCVNERCPQYSGKWPLPVRYQEQEAA